MLKHYVMYNKSEVIWCYEEEAYEKLAMGWKIHAVTDDENTADTLTEEACYLD